MTASLNLMRSGARSQWKLARASVIWSEWRRPSCCIKCGLETVKLASRKASQYHVSVIHLQWNKGNNQWLMVLGPILNGYLGSWWCQQAVAHQSSSDLLTLSWSQLDCIQLCTTSMHADMHCCRSCMDHGLQPLKIWVSSPYTLCLKKTTMTFYAITSMHINQFW